MLNLSSSSFKPRKLYTVMMPKVFLTIQDYGANSPRQIISRKRSLKFDLLHKANVFASITGESTPLKENQEPVKKVIERINCFLHKWVICIKLKMSNFYLEEIKLHKIPIFLMFMRE